MLCEACKNGTKGYIDIQTLDCGKTIRDEMYVYFCKWKHEIVKEPCNKFTCDEIFYNKYELTEAQKLLITKYLIHKNNISYTFEIDDFIKNFIDGKITEDEMRKELKFTEAKKRAR